MDSSFTVAVHGLVYLSHKGDVASSSELAQNICTNSARVRKVMACLKDQKIISAKEGSKGGFIATERLRDVTLREIAEALSLNPVEFSWQSGDTDADCLISSGMSDIMKDMYSNFNSLIMDYLNMITIGDIEKRLFEKKGA